MKIVYVLLALLVAAGVFILPITQFVVTQGLTHTDKKWAPDAVYFGARTRMRLMQYRSAAKILTKSVETFPKYQNNDRAYYLVGFCHEKLKNDPLATQWYKEFLRRWPKHPWALQAEQRLKMIEANTQTQ